MNKNKISFLFSLFVSIGFAQINTVNPIPQHVHVRDSIKVPSHFNIRLLNDDEPTQYLISSYFTEDKISNKGFSIRVGDINDRFPKRYLKKVPSQTEGYFIKITDKEIVVIGRDAAGAYYGLQTLIALLKSSKMPVGEIVDYPDVPARGVVEGFYGTPWDFEHRMRQIDFYGANKMNTYIYGPKDDPFHSSPNWRKPYPEKEAAQLKKLVDRARLNHVDFVWAIHPGKDIQWNDDDREALLHKFQLMHDLGVRSFAVFFDDISGEGTDPNQQAALLNYLNTEFIKERDEVKPLIMCPTEYNKGWSNPDGNYLETLGEKLDPSIRIMWTGNSVVSDIDKETMNWINAKIKRKAFIWWNYPVSDYVRNHLLLGPAYGNGKDIADDLSGFVSNPMEHAESSKIGIYGVADYSWNMTDYDAESNWHKSLKEIMPESYKAFEVFARHNSDLGVNGHGYRRKESEDFAPEAEQFLKQLKANQKISNLNKVENEFRAMVEASYVLLNSEDNPLLMDEIRPWVRQFQLLGQAGLSTVNMDKTLKSKQQDEFKGSYKAVRAIKSKMYDIDQQENQNPYQPGIKTATLVIAPMIDTSFTYLTQAYNKEFAENLEIEMNHNPHQLFTNVMQLQQQQITLKDRVLALNPPLEIIRFEPQAYIGFELQEPSNVKQIVYKLEPSESYKNLKIEVSTDGEEWEALTTKKVDKGMQASVEKTVKFIRITNTTSEMVETKIERFIVELK